MTVFCSLSFQQLPVADDGQLLPDTGGGVLHALHRQIDAAELEPEADESVKDPEGSQLREEECQPLIGMEADILAVLFQQQGHEEQRPHIAEGGHTPGLFVLAVKDLIFHVRGALRFLLPAVFLLPALLLLPFGLRSRLHGSAGALLLFIAAGGAFGLAHGNIGAAQGTIAHFFCSFSFFRHYTRFSLTLQDPQAQNLCFPMVVSSGRDQIHLLVAVAGLK